MAALTSYIIKGRNIVLINVRGVFNSADETDTVIIDKSTLAGPDGSVEPGSIAIEEITWSVGLGFDYVVLEWDHTTDDVVDYYSGQGFMEFCPGKNDPKSAGGTGDLVLSTSGGAAGDTYSFLIKARLKA